MHLPHAAAYPMARPYRHAVISILNGAGAKVLRNRLGRDRPAQAARGGQGLLWRVLAAFPGFRVLAPAGALWQEPAACRGPRRPILNFPGMLP